MSLLYLTILFPLIGFILLTCSRVTWWSDRLTTIIGVGSISLSAIITCLVTCNFYNEYIQHTSYQFSQILWQWISIEDFSITMALHLDILSVSLLCLVTGIGFLIHLYASWYMRGDRGYARFFAYTNLFIASMIVLLLADNLVFMYIGWEIVGLCSYLLIGFYFHDLKNSIAATKAFVTTRIGDVLIICAIFFLYQQFGTLNFNEMHALSNNMEDSSSLILLQYATFFLLGGAIAKSAQIPLHTWLIDAMVGPTPISALIHSATMVTAGVYLIVRTYFLFLLTPNVLYCIGIIGAITLLLSSFSAVVQKDIKRILAYSTMSQIGYMFLAIGVKAWESAIIHVIIHAFFKALLFLSAGSVILACNYEKNIFRMGGLRNSMPLIYLSFLIGGASLAAFPICTSGFYSKERILLATVADGKTIFLVCGLLGAFLTAIYIFRLIFLVFHGEEKISPSYSSNRIQHDIPLIVLLLFSTIIGVWILPSMEEIFPKCHWLPVSQKRGIEVISSIISLLGIFLAYKLWLGGPYRIVSYISQSRWGGFILSFWIQGWGLDRLYHAIFIKTYLRITRLLSNDPLTKPIPSLLYLINFLEHYLIKSEIIRISVHFIMMLVGLVIITAYLLFIGV
ncbi:NADH-quinone oxidoreductase subunit L [Candidatus Schneideria nysicola]|uniref:NADH-quinone oxidoreductase subunit L n=1 Tax=Candidatus Schneideria nysicola TaxID=1081631 RepID=UPI001CAA7814|nr:NADH-quinone oxidoreductase subunit L [Candidatus Schneideria nysicola]UAJ65829.1 NADH-quinone oxidoreductase subunit L [Candidatus Schneideria nysicola]